MKTWDVIIIGAGIIGLSLAFELRKKGLRVLIVERREPGCEASSAAGGMLVDCSPETPTALQPLAAASARMYPEFVRELNIESDISIDFREQGTLVFPSSEQLHQYSALTNASPLPGSLAELEPALAVAEQPAFYLHERCVDPRQLILAAVAAAKKRGVDFSSGDAVTAINLSDTHATGVTTAKTTFHAAIVVNCAGAWSGQITPYAFPTRPVKGQMLCLVAPSRTLLRHVIRTPEVYIIPRSDGRIVVGTTVEEAGFDKKTDPDALKRLRHEAIKRVPDLQDARILEDWAGLRPGTPDGLPILGRTPTPGYYVATGHFRDGILLAPITAQIMADVITGRTANFDLTPFSPKRFVET